MMAGSSSENLLSTDKLITISLSFNDHPLKLIIDGFFSKNISPFPLNPD
jgi:hypothetical protein